jgi:hypothetical protein
MNLHYPDLDPRPDRPGCAAPRHPAAAWMLVAIIAGVLGLAFVASSLVPDTRTFAERHLSVPTGARAL